MRVWPQRVWVTRTLVLTVVVLVAGALVTVGNAWADQGHRRGHDNTSRSASYSVSKSGVKSASQRSAAHRGDSFGDHRSHGTTNRHTSAPISNEADSKDAKLQDAKAGEALKSARKRSATAPHRLTSPTPASSMPAAASSPTRPDGIEIAPARPEARHDTPMRPLAVSSPAVAFSSLCEPGGRRVTATITNGTADAVTATITTASHRSTKEVAAKGRASVVLHLASGKAAVIAIGDDHVSFLAPACAQPDLGPSVSVGTAASSRSATGLALSLERTCESAGQPVAVHVANSAAVADEVVVDGVRRAVHAKSDVRLPVPGAGTGDVVTVAAGPTRYELSVPPCTQVAPVAADDGNVLAAGLTGGGQAGLNSDLALILGGLAAVALSVGVLVVAAARRLRWGSLR